MDEMQPWARNTGPGSEAQVVSAFTAWLEGNGWNCTKLPGYGDLPDIDAWHSDGRRLIVEAKGITRSAGANFDIGYGQLLRRISQYPDATFALVCAEQVLGMAMRVSSSVRRRLSIDLYTVGADGSVRHITDTATSPSERLSSPTTPRSG